MSQDIQFNVVINDPYNYDISGIVMDAVAKWDSVIMSRPSYIVSMNLVMNIEALDTGTLGSAYPVSGYYDDNGNQTFDYGDRLEVTGGNITFNESYIVSMRDTLRSDGNSSLYYVVLHEIGHVLGIGVWWEHFQLVNSLVESDGISRQYYIGEHAFREYRNYMQDTAGVLVGLPVENDGGAGTAGGHPEEGVEGGGVGGSVSSNNRYVDNGMHGSVLHDGLDHELMTGWADGGDVVLPMSRITLGFLQDMGFTVDYTQADMYLGFDALSFEGGVGGVGGVGGGDNLVCFLEGTKILCYHETTGRDEYIPIESLKTGMLVVTHKHGYVPIDLIGYRKIYNPGLRQSEKRIKNRLYVCNDVCYAGTLGLSDVTGGRMGGVMGPMGNLVLTGCHSLLVDNLSDHEMVSMRQECGGRLLQTDDKYRLMAYMSEHCPIYDYDGDAVIWHLVLRHTDVHMNYGLYANGVLAESCSLRMMEDYSGMTFV